MRDDANALATRVVDTLLRGIGTQPAISEVLASGLAELQANLD